MKDNPQIIASVDTSCCTDLYTLANQITVSIIYTFQLLNFYELFFCLIPLPSVLYALHHTHLLQPMANWPQVLAMAKGGM